MAWKGWREREREREREKLVPRGGGGGEWKPLLCLFIYLFLWANSAKVGKVCFEMIMLTWVIIFTWISGQLWFVFPSFILLLTSSCWNFKSIIAYPWSAITCLLKTENVQDNIFYQSCNSLFQFSDFDHLDKSKAFISNFISFAPSKNNGTELFNFFNGHSSWPNYLGGKEKDGTKGDQVILYASANWFRTCIWMISMKSWPLQTITVIPMPNHLF